MACEAALMGLKDDFRQSNGGSEVISSPSPSPDADQDLFFKVHRLKKKQVLLLWVFVPALLLWSMSFLS